jgi:hypothetical protein
MPDWLNVDLFQTLLLLGATFLAFKTFLAGNGGQVFHVPPVLRR